MFPIFISLGQSAQKSICANCFTTFTSLSTAVTTLMGCSTILFSEVIC